jgi:hypothetical protein
MAALDLRDRDQCPFCFPQMSDDRMRSLCRWHRLLLRFRLCCFLIRTRQSRTTWRVQR